MSDLFRIGSSGLNAAYLQLQTTGQNIANASTPGYVRREVLLSEAVNASSNGFSGSGVRVEGLRRIYDAYITREAVSSQAMSAQDAARRDGLSRLDNLFSQPEAGMGAAFDRLVSSFGDLSTRPADASVRTSTLAQVEGFVNRASGMDARLIELRTSTQGRMRGDAQRANDIMASLATFNKQMGSNPGSAEALALQDRRDVLLGDLNKIIKANATVGADGQVTVTTSTGEPLVTGDRASRLQLVADDTDPTRLQLTLERTAGSSVRLSFAEAGGSLAGMARFADQDIDAARLRLGQMVAGVAAAYNGQQARGLDATGQPGQPLFAFGQPGIVPGAGNSGSGALQASIDDASLLKASDYSVGWDGSQYSITRLSDGQVSTFGSLPQTLDGLRIEMPSGAPATGDRFLVRSASNVVSGLKALQTNPSRLATALPVVAETGAANTGDLRPGSIEISAIGPNTADPVAVSFDGAGNLTVSGVAGGPITMPYVSGMTLSFNGWSTTLNGAPAAGDTLNIRPTPNPASDNRNARAMQALGDAALVDGSKVIDRYAELVGEVGTRSQSAQSAADMSARLADEAERARSEVSGVNLDEEAARLLQFQQAYQASAKVISTASDMFKTLLAAIS
ncbi:MAG: flagellar hook-associated protein FlgK [Burkholderiales bacterium]|jgi:flagellar hook-associated protein 1 FlgK